MSEDFLTIKEASAKTGKAEITIRRFVQRIVKGSDRRQRALIQPSPEELQQHVDGPPPAWRISTRLLAEQFPSAQQGRVPTSDNSSDSGDTRIITLLKAQNATMERQLTVKDDQINSLTTLVHSLGDQLNERLRESNVLMRGLQDRLVLPDRVPQQVIMPAEMVTPEPSKSKRSGASKSEAPKPTRRGWVSRLFASGKSTT